jgi:colicin import membrane protein
MQTFLRDNASSLTVSLAGHGVLFLIMGLNLIFRPTPSIVPLQLAIEATVIDVGEIKRRRQAVERQEQAVENERRRKQEAERRKREEARIADQRKKADAERKRTEEAKRKAEQARVAEEKRKAEAERKRLEAEDKQRQAEMQANLQRELDAEEQRLAAIESGQLAQYLAVIAERVERNWVQPASAKSGVECVVHVTQIPGGEVINVRVGRCNGDAAVVRSIEAAVFNASPLPPPSDPSLFDRDLRFTFKPEE